MIRAFRIRNQLTKLSGTSSGAFPFRFHDESLCSGSRRSVLIDSSDSASLILFCLPAASLHRAHSAVFAHTYKSSSRAVNAARQAAADFDSMGDEADVQRIRMWAEEYAMHCGYKWLGIILYGGGKGLSGAEAVEERLKMQYAKNRKRENEQNSDLF
mmetsp:Transcript_10091/g.12606  ORF Transcript_10091/g.12606 Transcript_10091/m.12606 type:complete len:157 (-) Transcript_10091:1919-2389(-)